MAKESQKKTASKETKSGAAKKSTAGKGCKARKKS